MAGDTTYLTKACQGGAFNGQLATKTGAQTLAPKMSGGMPDLGGLDSAQKGSAAGVLKSGKAQSYTTNK